jgi:hypothetical protein
MPWLKILVDFAVSTIAYFFIGYAIAYGSTILASAETLVPGDGYALVKFFFLLTFPPRLRRSFPVASPSAQSSIPSLLRRSFLSGSCTRSSRALHGTAISEFKTG